MTLVEVLSLIALLAQGLLVFFAYKAIQKNEETAKKRAIVDLIIKQREDKELRKASKMLYDMRENHEIFSDLLKDPERMQDVLYALDTMEFVAVGIRLGAFDEGVYKELQCSKVRKTWESVSGFVMELRKQKNIPTLYQDLEHLANKWNATPISEIKKDIYR